MRRAPRAVVPPAAVWASRATRAPVPVPAALFCVNGVTACVCGVHLPLATRPPCLCRETPSSASRWPPLVPSSVAGLSAAFLASRSPARPEGPAGRPLSAPRASAPRFLRAGHASAAGPVRALGDGHAQRVHRRLRRPLSRPPAFSLPGHRPSCPEAFVRVAWTCRVSVASPPGTQGAAFAVRASRPSSRVSPSYTSRGVCSRRGDSVSFAPRTQ